jgi:hypothetical protein
VIPAVVSRFSPLSKNLRCVIKSHEESLGVEVEDLFPGMGGNIRGKGNVETPPGLASFLPGIYFPNLEALAEEQKRSRKIVPDGISSEIKGVQIVPIEFMAKAVEGPFGILSRIQNLTRFGLDTNLVPKKYTLILLPGKRTEKNVGRCRRYTRFVGLKYSKSKTEG